MVEKDHSLPPWAQVHSEERTPSGERDTGVQGGEETPISLPWSAKETRQVQGIRTEKDWLRNRGARRHPNSGAGKIKWDGSDQDCLYEIKDSSKTFSLTRALVVKLHRDAISQSKAPVLIVRFGDYEVRCLITKKAFGIMEE